MRLSKATTIWETRYELLAIVWFFVSLLRNPRLSATLVVESACNTRCRTEDHTSESANCRVEKNSKICKYEVETTGDKVSHAQKFKTRYVELFVWRVTGCRDQKNFWSCFNDHSRQIVDSYLVMCANLYSFVYFLAALRFTIFRVCCNYRLCCDRDAMARFALLFTILEKYFRVMSRCRCCTHLVSALFFRVCVGLRRSSVIL